MNRRVYTIRLAMALVVTFAAGVAQATQLTKGKITEVTVTYQLPHLINLASRTDEQILQITAVKIIRLKLEDRMPYSPDGSVLLDKNL